METTTRRLEKLLKTRRDIRTILNEHGEAIQNPVLSEYLQELLSSKELKRTEVVKRGGLDYNYINQLFNGNRTNPNRNIVLSLAFGFGLNKEETDRLLKIANVGALYPKNKRDAVIMHAFANGKTIIDTNEVLSSFGLETL